MLTEPFWSGPDRTAWAGWPSADAPPHWSVAPPFCARPVSASVWCRSASPPRALASCWTPSTVLLPSPAFAFFYFRATPPTPGQLWPKNVPLSVFKYYSCYFGATIFDLFWSWRYKKYCTNLSFEEVEAKRGTSMKLPNLANGISNRKSRRWNKPLCHLTHLIMIETGCLVKMVCENSDISKSKDSVLILKRQNNNIAI